MISRSYRGLIRTLILFSGFFFLFSFYTRNRDDSISAQSTRAQPVYSRRRLLFIGLSSHAINHPLRSVQRDIFNTMERDEVTIKFIVDVDEDMSIARRELLNFEVRLLVLLINTG
jgi:hypothetical protein